MDERTIADAAPETLPEIIGTLARLHALALARLVSPAQINKTEPEPDELLSAEQAAAFLNMTAVAVRRSAKLRPYRRVLGARTVRWSKLGLARFVRRAA
jgi:hypothetical protein